MKKTVLVFVFVLFCLNLNTPEAGAISAKSYCVIDAASGQILYQHNARVRRGMASTTKIMTALVALASGKTEEIATVSHAAAGTEGSSLYLKPGEKMRVYDLVCGLMLNSGNDAAVVLAEHIGGSVDAFVALMNEKAKEIGAYDTHFVNPNGLSDDAHYTTAYDLALLTAHALENSQFREIVATKQMTISTVGEGRKIYLTNHNKLLGSLDGCDGVKTGFTKATGRCLVSSVTRGGIQAVCVTLGAPDDWKDHTELHNLVHAEYQCITLAENGTYAGTAAVSGGDFGEVRGVLSRTVTGIYKTNPPPKVKIKPTLYENLKAPIYRGQTIGKANIYVNDTRAAEVDILAERDVAKLYIPTYFDILKLLLKRMLCI